MEAEKKKSQDDFYAAVSALARFIETADEDAGTPNIERKFYDGSQS